MALAYCYKEMPKGGDAVLHYEFAQSVSPKKLLPEHMIAKVFWGTRNYTEYEKYLKKVVARAPNYYPAKRDLADYLYYKRRIPEALPHYEELTKIDNYVIEDKMVLANCYFLMDKFENAETIIEDILSEDQSKSYLVRLLGYIKYKQDKFEEADKIIENYFTVVEEDKIIDSDYEYRGLIKQALEKDELAVEYFRKALEMNPSKYELWGKIAKSAWAAKDYCGAAEGYKIRLDSLEADADKDSKATDFYTLGIAQYYCKEDADNYKNAEGSFTTLTERAPTFAKGFYYLAKAQAGQEVTPRDETSPNYQTEVAAYGKAKDAYSKFIELTAADEAKNSKQLIEAYDYLTYLYYVKNDQTNFYPAVNKLLQLDPSNQAVELKKVVDAENGILPTEGN